MTAFLAVELTDWRMLEYDYSAPTLKLRMRKCVSGTCGPGLVSRAGDVG